MNTIIKLLIAAVAFVSLSGCGGIGAYYTTPKYFNDPIFQQHNNAPPVVISTPATVPTTPLVPSTTTTTTTTVPIAPANCGL